MFLAWSRSLPVAVLGWAWAHPCIAEPTVHKIRKPSGIEMQTESPYGSAEKLVGAGQTDIRFDETDINGRLKSPLMVPPITGSAKSGEKRFVKIRVQWHLEMIQSATQLESEDQGTF